MTISVITPTHNTKWLRQAYDSLLAQTLQDWEWILVPNGGVKLPKWVEEDHRIKVYPLESSSVGELKKHGFMQGTGEWLLELDHDDTLMPTALAEVDLRTNDFVYSNCVEVNEDGSPHKYNPLYGWEYRGYGEELECVSPLVYPSNFSRIWFAPNHLRAWRREFYHRIGGHDITLPVADDHDLVCRTYLEGRVTRIDQPLYRYVVHGDNTWLKNREEIQQRMWENHDKYFMPMALAWTDKQQLDPIDLGGGIDSPEGYTSVDRQNADIIADLDDDWDFAYDSSVGVLRAHDLIEHLKDPIHTMNEAWRVLAHGGVFDILVPSTDGVGAWCDPTHKSFWNARSFKYYTDPGTRRYIEPECVAKFQVVKLQNRTMWDERIPYVQAQLIAIKDGPRIHGESRW